MWNTCPWQQRFGKTWHAPGLTSWCWSLQYLTGLKRTTVEVLLGPGPWHRWHRVCKRCRWSEHREWLGWKKRGWKPTNLGSTYMVGNYSKLGSSSHIPECAKFTANTLEGAQKYISWSPIPWFSNANQWSQRTQSACMKLRKKQQNNKVFNPSNGIQINISQTFCFVNLSTEKVFKKLRLHVLQLGSQPSQGSKSCGKIWERRMLICYVYVLNAWKK